MDWQPISEAALWDEILSAERRMNPQVLRLWEAIKITPEKWSETTHGAIGGGFWVVAIIGKRVIWFNDIEDGFDCSSYVVPGEIAEYFCSQYELEMAVQTMLTFIETGRVATVRRAAPIAGHLQAGNE